MIAPRPGGENSEGCRYYSAKGSMMGSMLNKTHIPPHAAQLRVLEILRDNLSTWDELQAATEFNNDYLGLVLGELISQRKVRTGHRDDVRVYWLSR
jgi:hypothetical protein